MAERTTTAPKYGPDADPDKDNRPESHPPFLLTLKDRTTAEVKERWPDLSLPGNADVRWAWRSVHPDLRSTHGYRWPTPGHWAEPSGPFSESRSACPSAPGDGLCLAWTLTGAGSGGIRLGTGLLCAYLPDDVLGTWDPDHGTDWNKLRVRRAWVAEIIDTVAALKEPSADLTYADLTSANLRYADLTSANLRYADLRYANLRYADLRYANLTSADLRYANLRYADLRYADLRYADLRYANLTSADLTSADLRYANLTYANLTSADLRYANLTYADYTQLTLWPEGFDPKSAGARMVQ